MRAAPPDYPGKYGGPRQRQHKKDHAEPDSESLLSPLQQPQLQQQAASSESSPRSRSQDLQELSGAELQRGAGPEEVQRPTPASKNETSSVLQQHAVASGESTGSSDTAVADSRVVVGATAWGQEGAAGDQNLMGGDLTRSQHNSSGNAQETLFGNAAGNNQETAPPLAVNGIPSPQASRRADCPSVPPADIRKYEEAGRQPACPGPRARPLPYLPLSCCIVALAPPPSPIPPS